MNIRTPHSRTIHISWYIAWASAGVLVGVASWTVLPARLHIGAEWAALAAILFFVAALKRLRSMVIVVLLAGVLCGLWRGGEVRAGLSAYVPYIGRSVTVYGIVSDDASFGAHGDERLELKNVTIGKSRLPGIVWISSNAGAPVKRGDMLTVYGKLDSGFSSIAATMSFALVKRIERPHPGDVARQVRDWFSGGIQKSIPRPESLLGTGYLLGQRSALPATLNEQLQAVGLTHAVVASGYNLTILVALARKLLARFSKYVATLAGVVMITSFMLITGLSPSMTRAGIVSGLSMAAWYYGRSVEPVILLLFAAAITALLNPPYLWGDLGWCLSFASFAGVLIVGPLIEHYFWGSDPKPNVVRQLIIETMSAEVATEPIILFSFGQFASFALIANMLVLPLVPITMLLTLIAGMGGLMLPGVAHWFGFPAYVVLHYMLWIINYIAALPGALQHIHFGGALLAGYYGCMLAICIVLWRKTKHRFKNENA
jgi:competence protein ComEC